jgi:hypothetical protein
MNAIGAGTLVVIVPTAEGLVIAADSSSRQQDHGLSSRSR